MINGGRLLNICRNKELSIDFKLVGENGQTNRLIMIVNKLSSSLYIIQNDGVYVVVLYECCTLQEVNAPHLVHAVIRLTVSAQLTVCDTLN